MPKNRFRMERAFQSFIPGKGKLQRGAGIQHPWKGAMFPHLLTQGFGVVEVEATTNVIRIQEFDAKVIYGQSFSRLVSFISATMCRLA